jgi:hypothetical protein
MTARACARVGQQVFGLGINQPEHLPRTAASASCGCETPRADGICPSGGRIRGSPWPSPSPLRVSPGFAPGSLGSRRA